MEISYKDKKLLVYLLAVAIIAGAYFFGSKPFLEKQSVMSDEVTILQEKLDHCNNIYNNRAQYEENIAIAKDNYNTKAEMFLGGLDQENTIALIRGLEEDTNVWISRISFQDEELMDGGQAQEAEIVEEGTEMQSDGGSALIGTKQSLSLDYAASYSDFKKFIDYVQNFDKRLYIESISANYELETNKVSGILVLTQYAITGTEAPYLQPEFPNINTGVENIFTSLTGTLNTSSDLGELTVETLNADNDGLVVETLNDENSELTDETAAQEADSSEGGNANESEATSDEGSSESSEEEMEEVTSGRRIMK